MLDSNKYILLAAELRDLAERKTWEKAAAAMQEAAAAIEKLRGDNARLSKSILNDMIPADVVKECAAAERERDKESIEQLVRENKHLRRELADLHEDRDAAVCDLNIAKDCITCANKDQCGRSGCVGYVWRGKKGGI